MITIIQGPMWAGKTTELIKLLDDKKAICFDCCNSRETERDLHRIVPCKNLADNEVDFTNADIVAFDEVHLVNVFNQEAEFFNQVDKAIEANCDIVFVGLLYDYFSHYEWFPIWETIADCFGKSAKYIWQYSLKPCCCCGKTDSSVIYTRKLDNDSENRVGDNYGNVCLDCAWNETRKV